MSGRAEPMGGSSSDAAEGFSARWWLALPIAITLALIVLDQVAPAFSARWVESEQGLLEIFHILIPLASMVLALRILRQAALRHRPWLVAWLTLAAVSCFYIAGEEASWGQHFLDWTTPETWGEVNDQNETNLHNVSSWFDQKPRTLLEIGVIVGGIVLPILALFRPELRKTRFGVILPPLLCLPSAVLAEVTRLSERLADVFFGGEDPLFTRASEVQELFFYLFVLFYLIVLRQRLAAAAAP